MKCPSCLGQHKHRLGMRCACGYQFCFDPKRDHLSDMKFQLAIRTASGNGTWYYTPNQLYMALCRRMRTNAFVPFCLFLFTTALGAGLLIAGIGAFSFILGLIAIGLLFYSLVQFFTRPPTRSQFARFLDKWKAMKGVPERMIERTQLHQPPPEWTEPDIYEHGVERILIVQHDLLVDLFVLNGEHTKNRVLILSENRYPEYLIPIAIRFLNEKPDLPVFLLHDSTPTGQAMEARLREAGWLPLEGHPLIDMGLRPEDVGRMSRITETRAVEDPAKVPVDLLLFAWLSGGFTQSIEQQTSLIPVLDASQRSSTTETSFG